MRHSNSLTLTIGAFRYSSVLGAWEQYLDIMKMIQYSEEAQEFENKQSTHQQRTAHCESLKQDTRPCHTFSPHAADRVPAIDLVQYSSSSSMVES